MTAIGFVLTVIGFVIAIIVDGYYSRKAQALQSIAGFLILLGLLATCAGVTIKLWESLP